jgi:predicted transcriptional regulator
MLLLKEARLAKLSEEANKESRFMFSVEYDEYVKGDRAAVQLYVRKSRTTDRALTSEM